MLRLYFSVDIVIDDYLPQSLNMFVSILTHSFLWYSSVGLGRLGLYMICTLFFNIGSRTRAISMNQ